MRGCRIPAGRHRERKPCARLRACRPHHTPAAAPRAFLFLRDFSMKIITNFWSKTQLSRPRAVTAQDGAACAHLWLLQSHLHIWHRSGRKEMPASVLDAVRVFLGAEDTDLDFFERNNVFYCIIYLFYLRSGRRGKEL